MDNQTSSVDSSSQPSTNNDPNPSLDAPASRLGNYYENAVSKTLEKYLESLRFSLFKSKFPKLSKEYKKEFQDLHEELINQLRAAIGTDLKSLTSDNNLFSSLKSLDDMIEEQKEKEGEDAWRPSGNPENDIRDHIYHEKKKQRNCLVFLLETHLAENKKFEATVEQNHKEILELKKEIDDLEKELQTDFSTINALDCKELEKDIHGIFGRV